MANHPRSEIESAHDRYLETRGRIEAGELGWDALADFFTDDATFVDPAWGRIEGKAAIREFLTTSMKGLDGWSFPHEWRMIEGDRLVAAWWNRLPGKRADGSPYQARGLTIMTYAGDGKFSLEEDLLNMAHIFELIQESGWQPSAEVTMPPPNPRR
jgi:ketosteroid isomerase-like protein